VVTVAGGFTGCKYPGGRWIPAITMANCCSIPGSYFNQDFHDDIDFIINIFNQDVVDKACSNGAAKCRIVGEIDMELTLVGSRAPSPTFDYSGSV
jgi:hypothetical protein